MSTKPNTETSRTKGLPHEHVMSAADQELAHALKNEFLDLCLSHKASTLIALSAARCAAECFESIINDQGGEVFTVNAPSDFEQLIQLRAWKESAMTLLSRYDSIAETFGGKLGSSKIDNLDRGVRELRDDLLRLRKIAENALRFRIEQNGTCDHKEYMTALCTQREIREALAPKGE